MADPWFSAQTPNYPQTDPNSKYDTDMMYKKDKPITTLGCTRQTQYCLENHKGPDEERCERLRGYALESQKESEIGVYLEMIAKVQKGLKA